jgi:hypothetical protein
MTRAAGTKLVRAEMGTGEQVLIAGSFAPAGTGTTAPTGVVGSGFTVTQTASGVFLVAFTTPYKTCISFVCTAHTGGETSDFYAQGGDLTAATATAGTIRGIRTMTGGTPTDMSGETTPLVSFVAVFSKK